MKHHLAVLLLLMIPPVARCQDPDDFAKMTRSQFSSLDGKTIEWEIEQTTNVDAKSIEKNIQSIRSQIDQLDKYNQNYEMRKTGLEGVIAGLQKLPKVTEEKITITANLASSSKWRIECESSKAAKGQSTVYVADGSGVVFEVNNGTRTIQILRDPLEVMARVLRGVPEVQAAAALTLSATKTLKPLEGGVRGIEVELPEERLVSIGFDDKLICNSVGEKMLGSLRPVRETKLGENNTSIAKFFSSGTDPIQVQKWTLLRKEELGEVKDSLFSYEFVPHYDVVIHGADGSKSHVPSEQFVGKKKVSFE